MCQTHVRKSSGNLPRLPKDVSLHRGASIDEDREGGSLGFLEDTDLGAIQPGIGVPIDVTYLVPRRVIAVIGEFLPLASAALAQTLPATLPDPVARGDP